MPLKIASVNESSSPNAVTLNMPEAAAILSAAEHVAEWRIADQTEEYVRAAQIASSALPEHLRRRLLDFRRFGTDLGGFVIRGLPTGPVPNTPRHADETVGSTLTGAAVLSMCSAILGDQFGFLPELAGRIVQDILPVQGFEHTQLSISSRDELLLHVETAFTQDRADYVGLFCLRQDHERIAGTALSSAKAILPLLDDETIRTLREPRFATTVDESFLRGTGRTEPILLGPISVVNGSTTDPQLRADFAETIGTDRDSHSALHELRKAAQEVASVIRLEPGDLLFVDNNRAFHGRTSFRPRWDGYDRWLLRTFVAKDLARSAPNRPNDGRIVDADFRAADADDMPVAGHSESR